MREVICGKPGHKIGGKKGGEQDCLAEKQRSRENDSNFKRN